MSGEAYQLHPVGWVVSPVADRSDAVKQGDEGSPDAWIVFEPHVLDAMRDLRTGKDVLVLTWLHQADRDVLAVYPRGEVARGKHGVFSTRSPDRPNPIGLHQVTVTEVGADRVRVTNLEAIDGTPVLDLKPLLRPVSER